MIFEDREEDRAFQFATPPPAPAQPAEWWRFVGLPGSHSPDGASPYTHVVLAACRHIGGEVGLVGWFNNEIDARRVAGHLRRHGARYVSVRPQGEGATTAAEDLRIAEKLGYLEVPA